MGFILFEWVLYSLNLQLLSATVPWCNGQGERLGRVGIVFLDSPRDFLALVSSRLWSVFNNVAGGGQNWLCGLPQNRLFLRFFEISKIGPNGSELNSEHITLAPFSKKLNFFRDI